MATSVSTYNRSFAISLRLAAASDNGRPLCGDDLLLAHLHASKINRRPTAWVTAELASCKTAGHGATCNEASPVAYTPAYDLAPATAAPCSCEQCEPEASYYPESACKA